MAVLKCKMCGGTLEVTNSEKLVTCEFCGTTQTIPLLDNEKRITLHNRANAFRLRNEFDKAIITYESIVEEFMDDAEAYWGLVLCKYGIEYVDDSITGKKIPTCHRTLTKNIFDDLDYQNALKHSDIISKYVYETEAKEIDRLQKEIILISQKEEPYDIFICYKETDSFNRRTIDSVIAQEIYEELIRKGYKVFFSRITLESKLGSEYEPIIYAALNSSKVMLAIGTKPEYFNSVWVRNEWSRFIGMMHSGDNHKYLIPCYKDIDAYDLPEEMLSYQCQDLNKLGYMQDLTRGLDKIFNKEEIVKHEEKTINYGVYERIEMLLEEGDRIKAKKIVEDLLNSDYTISKAYMYSLIIELGLKKIDDLLNYNSSIKSNNDYNKALKFADEDYKKILIEYENTIQSNIEKIRLERYEKEYNSAISAAAEEKYNKAIEILSSLNGYKDSKELIVEYKKQRAYINKYYKAIGHARSRNINGYKEAISMLSGISDYKDSKELIRRYNEEIEKINKAKELRKAKFIKILKISTPIAIVITLCVIFLMTYWIPNNKLSKVRSLIVEGNYSEAIQLLKEIGNFKDANNQYLIKDADYAFREKKYQRGIEIFEQINGDVSINYNTEGGTYLQDVNEAYKEGFSFYGWTLDSYKITNNENDYSVIVDLKANYEIVYYYLEYDLDGGDAGEIPVRFNYLDIITLPKPEKEGYTFVGWYDGEKTEEEYVIEKRSSDIVLKAIYKVNKYSINLNYNDVNYDNKPIEIAYGDSFVLPQPTKKGYTFIGWFDGSTEFEDGKYIYTNDINLDAKWEIVYYPIKYIYYGGILTDMPTSYTYNDEVIIPNIEREGYTFIGWNDGVETKKDYVINKNSEGECKLEAIFSANKYTINLDVGNGTCDETSIEIFYNKVPIFPIATSNDSRYKFVGWFYNDKKIENLLYNYTNDITVKAKYEKIYYIEYDLGGGQCSNLRTEFTESTQFFINTPTKDNHVFVGWFDESETKIQNGNLELRDYKLEAKWVKLIKSGNYVYFGKYPQNKVEDAELISTLKSISNVNSQGYIEYSSKEYKEFQGNYYIVEPIKWRVMERGYESVLLSEVILDSSLFQNNSYRTISGKTIFPSDYNYSTIRHWLNGLNGRNYQLDNYLYNGFAPSAFNYYERQALREVFIDNSNNEYNDDCKCINNRDRIYLLSYKELLKYFPYETDRKAKVTAYSKARNVYTYGEYGDYWTRSCEHSSNSIYVSYLGSIDGHEVDESIVGVRPVIKLTL